MLLWQVGFSMCTSALDIQNVDALTLKIFTNARLGSWIAKQFRLMD